MPYIPNALFNLTQPEKDAATTTWIHKSTVPHQQQGQPSSQQGQHLSQQLEYDEDDDFDTIQQLAEDDDLGMNESFGTDNEASSEE